MIELNCKNQLFFRIKKNSYNFIIYTSRQAPNISVFFWILDKKHKILISTSYNSETVWESLYFELILLIQPMNSSMSLFWISNVNVMTDEPYNITENVYVLEDINFSCHVLFRTRMALTVPIQMYSYCIILKLA